jgi:hypothetical protein
MGVISVAPYLWNKLDSLGQASELGPNMTYPGSPVFYGTGGKFGGYHELMTGQIAKRILFPGIPMASLNSLEECTICLWVKLDYNIVNGSVPVGTNLWGIENGSKGIRPTFQDRFYIENYFGGGTTLSSNDARVAITKDVWTHTAVVFNKSSSVLGGTYKTALYINASEAMISTVFTDTVTGTAQFNPGWIYQPVPQEPIDGGMDNLMIFPYALTPTQLAYLVLNENWTSARRILRPQYM